VRLPSWMPRGDFVFHSSTSKSNIIPLASHSLRDQIISFDFFRGKREGTPTGVCALADFFFVGMKWVHPLPWLHYASPIDPQRSLLATLGLSLLGFPFAWSPKLMVRPYSDFHPWGEFLVREPGYGLRGHLLL